MAIQKSGIGPGPRDDNYFMFRDHRSLGFFEDLDGRKVRREKRQEFRLKADRGQAPDSKREDNRDQQTTQEGWSRESHDSQAISQEPDRMATLLSWPAGPSAILSGCRDYAAPRAPVPAT